MNVFLQMNSAVKLFDSRGGHNRYSCNFNFFKKWTDEMAYVLGFLYADGCIIDAVSSRTQYIQFDSKDKEILEKIRRIMESEHLLGVRPPHSVIHRNGTYISAESFTLRIGSRRMFNDLIRFGIVPNKSKIIEFPSALPDKYLGQFIRGYFDGDGSVVFNKKRWIRVVFTSGSKNFLEQLSSNLSKVLGIRKRLVRLSHRSYQLYYFTQEGLKILRFIYKDAEKNNLYLDRKYRFYKKLSVQYNYILNKYIKQVAR